MIDTSKIIHAPVGGGRYTVTAPIVKEDYGLYLLIEGLELPSTYEVDFSNDEHSGTSVTMIGNSDGVLIPSQFIASGKDVFAFLYHVGVDYGKTIYKFRIPNKVRPDRTNQTPTPEEQSTIDQCISALNDAVEEAQGYAQTASDKADSIHDMTATAQTLPEGSEATASYNAETGVMSFGIPVGATGAQGEQGVAGRDGVDGQDGADGFSPTVSVTSITGGHEVSVTDAQGTQTFNVMDGDDYVLTAQDKDDIADIVTPQVEDDILKAFPTDTASGNIASFSDGADNIPLKSLVVNIDPVQDLSNGDPSPTNICPITGWTGVNLRKANENLWDDAWYSLGNHMSLITNEASNFYGYYSGSVASWASAQRSNGQKVLFPDGVDRLTVAADFGNGASSGAFTFRIYFYYSDGTEDYNGGNISISADSKERRSRTSTSGKKCTGFVISTSAGTGNQNGRIKNIRVSFDGSTEYVAPVLNPLVPISWQSSAGTVYGGQLDVLTGKLTVYPYYGSYNGETLTGEWISDRDVYAVGTTPTIGAQVVNVGAQGTEYQLDAHEIKSILGTNNIWADTGDSAVEYRADTEMYIDEQIPDVPVQDVQVNGTSVLNNGVANIPMAGANSLGAVMVANGSHGLQLNTYGKVMISSAESSSVKGGTNTYTPITPSNQHESVFYGLAKASGDSTQSASSNAVGTYTEDAKSKISEMLGGSVSVSGTTPTIVAKSGIRYVCGEVSTLTITAPASGCIDVLFESGSTPTVLTVNSAKANTTIKWANGFDPTSLETGTYEINILDGEWGVSAAWT